jgi:hypothetical protein
VLERIRDRLAQAFTTSGSPLERLDRSIEVLIDTLAEHSASARLLLRAIFEDDDFDEGLPEGEHAERTLAPLTENLEGLLREGVAAGAFRALDVRHTVQTLIGATVYHFASGEFGETLMGRPLLSAEEVRRRKEHVKSLLHYGLAAPTAAPAPGGTR